MVEVNQISKHGFWLLLPVRETFLPFESFPWFREATIAQLQNVRLIHSANLYWPDLDVDLAVESITHPERYPLVSGVPHGGRQRAPDAGRVADKPGTGPFRRERSR